MEEKKYKIIVNNNIIASDMYLDVALILIEAYVQKYYNEEIKITLTEEKKLK